MWRFRKAARAGATDSEKARLVMFQTRDWAVYSVAVYVGLLLGGALIAPDPAASIGESFPPDPVPTLSLHAEPHCTGCTDHRAEARGERATRVDASTTPPPGW